VESIIIDSKVLLKDRICNYARVGDGGQDMGQSITRASLGYELLDGTRTRTRWSAEECSIGEEMKNEVYVGG